MITLWELFPDKEKKKQKLVSYFKLQTQIGAVCWDVCYPLHPNQKSWGQVPVGLGWQEAGGKAKRGRGYNKFPEPKQMKVGGR
jgi:hypothetical protein